MSRGSFGDGIWARGFGLRKRARRSLSVSGETVAPIFPFADLGCGTYETQIVHVFNFSTAQVSFTVDEANNVSDVSVASGTATYSDVVVEFDGPNRLFSFSCTVTLNGFAFTLVCNYDNLSIDINGAGSVTGTVQLEPNPPASDTLQFQLISYIPCEV